MDAPPVSHGEGREGCEAQDLKTLLSSFVDELKEMKQSFALPRPDEFIANNANHLPSNFPDYRATPQNKYGDPQLSVQGLRRQYRESGYSTDARSGPILQEALRRYDSDAVPHWSTLYGTHLTKTPGPALQEDVLFELDWQRIIGDCWLIPHDNRVGLCFLASRIHGPEVVARIRNFLAHYHRPQDRGLPKGEYFNVWDWFDTGISAFWYPGKQPADVQREASHRRIILRGIPSGDGMTSISQLVAPWRRIINLKGLTSLTGTGTHRPDSELTDLDLCPFLHCHTGDSIFQEPINNMIWQAVRYHLRCVTLPQSCHAELGTKGCLLFHVTFYEILSRDPQGIVKELWPCGELHSDDEHRGGRRRLRESSLTIMAIPSIEGDSSPARAIFWTILCMRPHQFPHPHYFEKRDDFAQGKRHEMINAMSEFVHKSLLSVIERWEEIAEYFDGILCEKKALLDPDYHDSLLTDDEVFSRSKKYFWAIEFLKEVDKSISDNIRQAKQFADTLKATMPEHETAQGRYRSCLHKHNAVQARFEALKARFSQKKDEAIALRDGLFNASAVMESRASTRLGENIRLLTWVSIFFLPLSFCASLWSINDSLFSMAALSGVMPLIAILTYTIALNLNSISFAFRSTCLLLRQKVAGILTQKTEPITPLGSGSPLQGNKTEGSALVENLFCVWWNCCRQLFQYVWPNAMGYRAQEKNILPLPHLGDVHIQVQVDVESRSASPVSVRPQQSTREDIEVHEN